MEVLTSSPCASEPLSFPFLRWRLVSRGYVWDVLAPVRNCWTEDFRAGEGSGQEEGPCLQGGRRDLRVLRWAHAWGPHPGLLSAGALFDWPEWRPLLSQAGAPGWQVELCRGAGLLGLRLAAVVCLGLPQRAGLPNKVSLRCGLAGARAVSPRLSHSRPSRGLAPLCAPPHPSGAQCRAHPPRLLSMATVKPLPAPAMCRAPCSSSVHMCLWSPRPGSFDPVDR